MSKKVKVYTTSTCPFCTLVKNFLNEKNISFEEVDVGLDHVAAREMVDKTGQLGVPVVDIDGKIIVGFDREALSRAL